MPAAAVYSVSELSEQLIWPPQYLCYESVYVLHNFACLSDQELIAL
jgi:hypothetical protein